MNKELINSGIIDKSIGSVYNDLFELRQESDYEDYFIVDKKTVEPFISRTKTFIDAVNDLLR